MDFNTTSMSLPTSRRRSIVAARIHAYRNAVTEEQLFHLKQGGCDTSNIRLKLYSVVNEMASSLVDSASIEKADLTKPGWIVFSGTAQLFEQRSNRIQSLIIADSSCNAALDAFNMDRNHSKTFLVAFFNSSLEYAPIDGAVEAKGISKRTSQNESRSTTETCRLHTIEVCFFFLPICITLHVHIRLILRLLALILWRILWNSEFVVVPVQFQMEMVPCTQRRIRTISTFFTIKILRTSHLLAACRGVMQPCRTLLFVTTW